VQLVLELPERVALEIEACGVLEHSCQDMPSSQAGAATNRQATFSAMGSASSAIRTMLAELGLVLGALCVGVGVRWDYFSAARWRRRRRAEHDVAACGWWVVGGMAWHASKPGAPHHSAYSISRADMHSAQPPAVTLHAG
jgi:hypothetical protein